MFIVILTLAIIASIFGLLLAYSAVRFKVEGDPVVDKIDALLPQTQCGQCTYPGCRPYAEAMAKVKPILTSVHPVVKQPLLPWLICSV